MADTIQNEGASIGVTISTTVTAGDVLVFSELVGVALASGVSGDLIGLALEGVYETACLASDDIAVGDILYWDVADDECTLLADSGTNKKIGYAATAATTGVETVQVRLER